MKLAGSGLLLAGWGLVLAALILLEPISSRVVFMAAGFAVEILGLILVARAHLVAREEK
jgi:hypothetical protein